MKTATACQVLAQCACDQQQHFVWEWPTNCRHWKSELGEQQNEGSLSNGDSQKHRLCAAVVAVGNEVLNATGRHEAELDTQDGGVRACVQEFLEALKGVSLCLCNALCTKVKASR
eukprot:1727756-Amphidinium_carterae.1